MRELSRGELEAAIEIWHAAGRLSDGEDGSLPMKNADYFGDEPVRRMISLMRSNGLCVDGTERRDGESVSMWAERVRKLFLERER